MVLQSNNLLSLPRRVLGNTNLMVTPICIGGGVLGNMPETFTYSVSEEQALATLRKVFQSPINFLDTAAAYGDGESERRIGIVVEELGGLPDGFVLSTKADRNLTTGDFSGDQIKRSIERSLRLLGLSNLQLVYLHDPEYTSFENITSTGGPLDVLISYKAQGIIEHLGIAGGPIGLLIQYLKTGVFETLITHNRYTLLYRNAQLLIDFATDLHIPVLNAAPYGGGILAKGSTLYPRYAYRDALPHVLSRLQQIEQLCQDYNLPLSAAALQFSMRNTKIASTIVGVSRPERVDATLELANYVIPDEFWEKIDTLAISNADPEVN